MRIERAAVLGAGMMGAGIAYAQARIGIETVLVDVDQSAAERGKARVAKIVESEIRADRMPAYKGQTLLALIHPTDDYAQIDGASLIVEAVFENRSVKAQVTRQAERLLAPNGIFATNTSTLPIDSLANATLHPDRFIGIHFFSPVERMSLVEIIVGRRTSEATLARALVYARALGKIPITVNDHRGFYTSRTFNTYVMEGLVMLSDGIAPALIDNSGRMCSMPRGPLELADDVALDLLVAVEKQTAEDSGTAFPARPEQKILNTLVAEHGRYGRKNGKGFYDYSADRQSKALWPGLAAIAPVIKANADRQLLADLRDRLLYRQALEAARCLEEGVVSDPREADVGALLGWGFASWTGGPLSFIDQIGAANFVARAEQLAATYGPRFLPPQGLKKMAARRAGFYAVTE